MTREEIEKLRVINQTIEGPRCDPKLFVVCVCLALQWGIVKVAGNGV